MNRKLFIGSNELWEISINKHHFHIGYSKQRSVVYTKLIRVPVNRGQSDSAEKCNRESFEGVLFLRQSQLATPSLRTTLSRCSAATRSTIASQESIQETISACRIRDHCTSSCVHTFPKQKRYLHSSLFAFFIEVDTW